MSEEVCPPNRLQSESSYFEWSCIRQYFTHVHIKISRFKRHGPLLVLEEESSQVFLHWSRFAKV